MIHLHTHQPCSHAAALRARARLSSPLAPTPLRQVLAIWDCHRQHGTTTAFTFHSSNARATRFCVPVRVDGLAGPLDRGHL